MVSRRGFLKSSTALSAAAIAVATLAVPQHADAQALNPKQVPKFVNVLPNPLAPPFLWQPDPTNPVACLTPPCYTLQIQQFQQTLGLGGTLSTTVWGYGNADQSRLPPPFTGNGGLSSFPGRTFEVQRGTPITVTYVNSLVNVLNGTTVALPNPMPVDLTLDWANPGAVGGITPVPVVAHLHGGDSEYLSDGLPDAWGTPFAPNLPTIPGQQGRLFSKPYTYENNQEAGHLWYHDHALGITRTNVYMGLAGFYFLRDANENALRTANILPAYPFEVPIVIQDREFTSAGQLFYPAGVNPVNSHLPEFFGRVILANGQAWPKLNVEPRNYRLRLLNGSDSRFYDLRFEVFAPRANVVPGKGRVLPIMVVGNELGLLDRPALAALDGRPGIPAVPNVLAIGPGERYDVVVDFTGIANGSRVVMTNTARSPYPDAAKPEAGLTDRIMAFDVTFFSQNEPINPAVPNASVRLDDPATIANETTVLRGLDTADEPATPVLGSNPIQPGQPAPDGMTVRKILLFEGTDVFGRLQTMLGPVNVDPVTTLQGTLTFKDAITERPVQGTTEVWEFYNATVDAHPMHMHLVDFRIIDRALFTGVLTPKVNSDGSNGAILTSALTTPGTATGPSAWEAGKKDTVKLFPGEVTRVLVSFNRAGEYVYHCHILSHEDHEMMRPYEVVAP